MFMKMFAFMLLAFVVAQPTFARSSHPVAGGIGLAPGTCRGDGILGRVCNLGHGVFSGEAEGASYQGSVKVDDFYAIIPDVLMGETPVEINPGSPRSACEDGFSRAFSAARSACKVENPTSACQAYEEDPPTGNSSQLCSITVYVYANGAPSAR